jgi:prepilin-type N-terminal cleavage/methylation domain-containing protein
MPVRSRAPSLSSGSHGGFTLVEMIVVVFLLALAMLGLLSVFDASARINKSESDIADAQGAVRYGIYSMTRAIRMAGSGGLYVTQAVLNKGDKDLTGIIPKDVSYDNVPAGTQVISLNGNINVRPGTDMIEIRGVINSPLIGFDLATGCNTASTPCDPATGCLPCQDTKNLNVAVKTQNAHVNDDATQRTQFSQIDAYTAGVTGGPPMLVLVAFNDDLHTGCSLSNGAQFVPLYPQVPYNVGAISSKTALCSTPCEFGLVHTFGSVNFADPVAIEFNTENPADAGTAALAEKNVRHAGILDDLIFFIDNTDSFHPALAQGTRRGDKFDVVALADDVEDMQIAYGVDKDNNNAINRLTVTPTASDADTNVSSQPGGDEWVPNVAGADNPFTGDSTPLLATNFFDVALHCPRLHAVMISLVAKSHSPDPTYRSPSARGLLTMNSPVSIDPPHPDTAHYSGIPVTTYKRRVQTLKINLRNYAYEGS